MVANLIYGIYVSENCLQGRDWEPGLKRRIGIQTDMYERSRLDHIRSHMTIAQSYQSDDKAKQMKFAFWFENIKIFDRNK